MKIMKLCTNNLLLLNIYKESFGMFKLLLKNPFNKCFTEKYFCNLLDIYLSLSANIKP